MRCATSVRPSSPPPIRRNDMRAAWYERNGEARDTLQIGEIPTPVPGPGEVRVAVHTSGVNPSDVKSRRGRPLAGPRVVPHSDAGGIIDAVGQGVDRARLGERVWVWNGQWQRPMGTAAQAIVVPSAMAVRLSDQCDFAAAACVGIPLLTAYEAVRRLGDIAGRDVLVIGAASSVGHYAAQLAVMQGARVIGTVSSEAKAAHARAAGVCETIDYRAGHTAERVRDLTGGRGVQGIVDMDFSTTASLVGEGALAPHGTVVCFGSNVAADHAVPFRTLLFTTISLQFFLIYDLTAEERAHAIRHVSALLDSGRLHHTIGARFALDDIVAAHEAVESGRVMGNVVLDIVAPGR